MNNGSSKSILKSTGLVGGSQVITVLVGLVRAKVIAVVLGPGGTGLIAALQSSTALVQTVLGLGLSKSSVRDIAQAHARGEAEELARTVKTQRRAVLVTGLAGLVATVLLAEPLSRFTFGHEDYAFAIRLLAVAVFFNLIVGGQSALIQGMRRIKDLALLSITGALLSTAIAVPLIYFYREGGIAIYLVVLAAGQYVVAYYFARRIFLQRVPLDWSATWQRAKDMLRLGLGFMGAALATALAGYLIRVFLIRYMGLGAAGLYQAAMGISGIYINVVLQAMGKDFYPRLAAVAHSPEAEIKLINEQTEVGMILAAPGLLFTLALAPVAINVLYTPEYAPAYGLLQWMILGVFIRTISWPMAFVLVARGRSVTYLFAEIGANLVHVVLVVILGEIYGLIGVAMAFFGMYALYLLGMYFLVNRQNGFTWQRRVVRNLWVLSTIFGLSFVLLRFTGPWVGSLLVCGVGLGVSYYALQKVLEILEVESLRALWRMFRNKIKKK